jgi:hypothetical protein
MMRVREKLAWALAAALAVAVVATFAGVVKAGPLEPPRPPGPTQANLIYQPAGCGGFPINITQPGSYALAENITMPSGCAKNGIVLNADNVSLDLRGFAVQGVPGALTGISTGTFQGLTLTNGKVTGWPGGGIDFAAGNSMLAHLQVMFNGPTALGGQVRLGHTSRLSDCVVSNSSGLTLGVVVFGDFNVVEDCSIVGNILQGLKVAGTHNRISRNFLSGNPSVGNQGACADLWVAGTDNVIEHNTVVYQAFDTCPFYVDGSATGTVMYGNVAHSGGANGVVNYTINNNSSDIAPIGSAGAAYAAGGNISD